MKSIEETLENTRITSQKSYSDATEYAMFDRALKLFHDTCFYLNIALGYINVFKNSSTTNPASEVEFNESVGHIHSQYLLPVHEGLSNRTNIKTLKDVMRLHESTKKFHNECLQMAVNVSLIQWTHTRLKPFMDLHKVLRNLSGVKLDREQKRGIHDLFISHGWDELMLEHSICKHTSNPTRFRLKESSTYLTQKTATTAKDMKMALDEARNYITSFISVCNTDSLSGCTSEDGVRYKTRTKYVVVPQPQIQNFLRRVGPMPIMPIDSMFSAPHIAKIAATFNKSEQDVKPS